MIVHGKKKKLKYLFFSTGWTFMSADDKLIFVLGNKSLT